MGLGEGLLSSMDEVLHSKEDSRHGALATFVTSPSSPSCLSFVNSTSSPSSPFCSSLLSICNNIPSSPQNLAKTRESLTLATHFMLMLQDLDSKKNCDREELGYASMFQFYLDFYALAVTSTGLEGSQAFPVKPQDGRIYDTKKWIDTDIDSPGWKPLKEIQTNLTLLYWRSHPLQSNSWRCLDVTDKKHWQGASEALKVESFGEKDLLSLADTMSALSSRLEPIHREFQMKLIDKASQKRRCQIL